MYIHGLTMSRWQTNDNAPASARHSRRNNVAEHNQVVVRRPEAVTYFIGKCMGKKFPCIYRKDINKPVITHREGIGFPR